MLVIPLLLIGVANPRNAGWNASWSRPDQFEIQNPHLYLLVDRTVPLLARRPDRFQIQIRLLEYRTRTSTLHIYLRFDWISLKFKFVCLSFKRVPLLARQPDQFEIQNPHLYLLVHRITYSKFGSHLYLRRPLWLFQIQNQNLHLYLLVDRIGLVLIRRVEVPWVFISQGPGSIDWILRDALLLLFGCWSRRTLHSATYSS